MFRFGKKKRYSIGEKINYYYATLNNPNTSIKKKRWARQRIKDMKNIRNNIKQGDVFIVHDKLFGNTSGKPRYVVVAKNTGNNVDLLPVRKSDEFMTLSLFDNQRMISVKNSKNIHKNGLYEKRGFKGAKNAKLLTNEKAILEKKVKKYLP